MKKISQFALQSFKGIGKKSVDKIFPEIIVKAENLLNVNKNCYYVGTKNTNVISTEYINKLEEIGLLHHTVDKMADGGRAIDIELQNPITGRLMTGSSSGTAINVFLGINDIGIGTDGGGSVLAPALSLNLYGCISPIIEKEHRLKFAKKSTDNIEFVPSIGFISKDIDKIEYILSNTILKKMKKRDNLKIVISTPLYYEHFEIFSHIKSFLEDFEEVKLEYDSLDRKKSIDELKNFDFENNILITFEGPVDLYEYGDSVMGHYDKYSKDLQKFSHKYYLKVVNMVGLTAFSVPTSGLGKGVLIICKSDESHILKALEIAKGISYERSDLETNYFK